MLTNLTYDTLIVTQRNVKLTLLMSCEQSNMYMQVNIAGINNNNNNT